MSARHEQGSAARTAVGLVLMLVVGVALGAGGTYYWFRSHPAPPAQRDVVLAPLPSIVTSPAETVPIEIPSPASPDPLAEVTLVPAEGSPHPGRVREARVTKPTGPAIHPVTPPDVVRPPTQPVPTAPSDPRGARRFVQGATSVENRKPIGTDLRGFDTAEVDMKRAPAVNGHLELEMDPDHVVPGQPYVVRVFLANDGSKSIEIGGMKAATLVDGKWIQVPLTPERKVVIPRQRALLRELPGTWKDTVGSWAVEVEITSKRQDVYKNRLTWK